MEANKNLTPKKPDNYLVWSILSTVLCCVPLGIVAIVYSTKVDKLWESGNFDEAEASARKAKTWMLIAIACGVIGSILMLVLGGFAAILGD